MALVYDSEFYQRHGFVVHPLNGKIPVTPAWQKLEKTPENINNEINKGRNVGLVAGKVSNVTVIDFDSMLFMDEIVGESRLNTLCAERTKGRGHVYYKYNPRLPASKHHDLGIEILSDGNNVVMPPSVHPSGDLYHWINAEMPIIEMPKEIEQRILGLFDTEAHLKQIIAKCRHCFRDVLKRKPDVHGAEGREYMVALCADLKAKNATEEHGRLFAKLLYGKDYDEKLTMREWRNVDRTKPWTCDVLRAKLPAYIDLMQCEKCEERRKSFVELPKVFDPSDNTDVGNARRMVSMFGEVMRYCHPWKSWLCWNGKYWERDSSGQIFRYAKQTIEIIITEAERLPQNNEKEKLVKHAIASKSATKLKAMVFLAESEPGMAIVPDSLDRNKMLFNVQNGTIDLLSGILREHRREDYITRISPSSFEGKAKNDDWIKFLGMITKDDPELIKYLQKLAGALLSGEVREKALYILHGKKDTGKTTFVEALAYVLAEYAETMPIESLMKRARGGIPNDIAALKGKRFVFVDEPDFGDRLSEGLIKKLTGLDTINARFLNEEFFKFKPEFKLLISTNNAPDITDKDQAIWGRIKRVPFLMKLEKKDTALPEKLRMEASGILNWMVEGCMMWQKEGMNEPEIIQKATEEYKEDMDTLSDFFNGCCIKGEEYKITHEYLYTAFRLWCIAVQRQPMSKKAFTAVCENRDFERTDTIMIQNRRCRGFKGITLNQNLIKSVQEYFDMPSKVKDITEQIGTDLLKFAVASKGNDGHMCTYTMCDMRSTCSGISNMCILPSVQSVQSVQSVKNNKDILIKIKELYDNINKPDDILILNRYKEDMIMNIMTDFDFEGVSEEQAKKVIEDYCSARGWQ